jgi:hypothetical protein
MICSALVYILLTCSSDLTAPLPWIHYTSAKEFTILQKQLLLHTNRQGVKTLCTVSLLLKAFSGRPLLPIVALQCFCRPPPVRHGCKPSLSTPIGCILWLVFTCYSVLSINRRLQRLQELKKGFFFIIRLFLALPTAKDYTFLIVCAKPSLMGEEGDIDSISLRHLSHLSGKAACR